MSEKIIPDEDKSGSFEKDPSGFTMNTAWEQVLINAEFCLSKIREEPGCEEAIITICILNGRTVDMYSLPEQDCKDGVPKILENRIHGHQGAQRTHQDTVTVTVSPKSPKPHLDRRYIRNESKFRFQLSSMTVKQMKRFASVVRQQLGLRRFTWPKNAEEVYKQRFARVIPGAPGKTGARKDDTIMMFKLSAETNTLWKQVMSRQIGSVLGEQKLKSRTHSNMHRFWLEQKIPTQENATTTNRAATNQGKTDSERKHSPDSKNDDRSDDKVKDSNPNRNQEEIPQNNPIPGTEDTNRNDNPRPKIGNRIPNLDHTIAVSSRLPKDALRVVLKKSIWTNLEGLMRRVRHPTVPHSCEWFRQVVRGDGNCLFSAVMLTTESRGLPRRPIHTVIELRNALKTMLRQLADSGTLNSCFRREWLASCIHDAEDSQFRNLCQMLKETAKDSHRMDDMEKFLVPLRVYVRNWADMVGDSYWGGHLTAELHALASITGTAIETMQKMQSRNPDARDAVEVCDTRHGDQISFFSRTGIYVPVKATLPSMENECYVMYAQGSSRSGCFGMYPIIRLIVNNGYYDAFTSRCTYPIPPVEGARTTPSSSFFDLSDTLTEPYASLNDDEHIQFSKINDMIDNWRRASLTSEQTALHANSTVVLGNGEFIRVSELSRLQLVPSTKFNPDEYKMSDGLVSAYMSLLQRRADNMHQGAVQEVCNGPPHSYYMHSWFFHTIRRGNQGPAAKRRRLDLDTYDQIIIPILIDDHWVLAICYRVHGVIAVYDPLGHRREDVFRTLKDWADVKLPLLPPATWEFHHLIETRNCTQEGIVDCGIYVCKAAESLGLGIPLRVSQYDVPYIRKRMLTEFMLRRATPVTWPRK